MNLSVNTRRAIFGIGGGLFVFWLLQKTLLSSSKDSLSFAGSAPVPSEEDIQKALYAYQAAMEAGEDKEALMSLNSDLAKEFKVRIYQRKKDGALIATDLNGKELDVFE